MDIGSSLDTLLTGAFVLLAAAIGVSGAVLLVLGRAAPPPVDAVVTEIGAGGVASGRGTLDEPAPAEAKLLVVPMRRDRYRQRDVEDFLRAATQTQARLERAVTPEQARMIDAAQRVRERHAKPKGGSDS